METKDYKPIVLFVFLQLSIVTIGFYFIYRPMNPYDFPGLEVRLFWATLVAGFISLALYSPEIVRLSKGILSKIGKPTPPLPKMEIPKSRLEEMRYEYYEKIRGWTERSKAIFGTSRTFILRSVLVLAAFVLIVVIPIALFVLFFKLTWILLPILEPYVPLFILIYILASIKYRIDSRIPIAMALFLLVLVPIILILKLQASAEQLAIYAYYLLVAGVVVQFSEYIRESRGRG